MLKSKGNETGSLVPIGRLRGFAALGRSTAESSVEVPSNETIRYLKRCPRITLFPRLQHTIQDFTDISKENG